MSAKPAIPPTTPPTTSPVVTELELPSPAPAAVVDALGSLVPVGDAPPPPTPALMSPVEVAVADDVPLLEMEELLDIAVLLTELLLDDWKVSLDVEGRLEELNVDVAKEVTVEGLRLEAEVLDNRTPNKTELDDDDVDSTPVSVGERDELELV